MIVSDTSYLLISFKLLILMIYFVFLRNWALVINVNGSAWVLREPRMPDRENINCLTKAVLRKFAIFILISVGMWVRMLQGKFIIAFNPGPHHFPRHSLSLHLFPAPWKHTCLVPTAGSAGAFLWSHLGACAHTCIYTWFAPQASLEHRVFLICCSSVTLFECALPMALCYCSGNLNG